MKTLKNYAWYPFHRKKWNVKYVLEPALIIYMSLCYHYCSICCLARQTDGVPFISVGQEMALALHCNMPWRRCNFTAYRTSQQNKPDQNSLAGTWAQVICRFLIWWAWSLGTIGFSRIQFSQWPMTCCAYWERVRQTLMVLNIYVACYMTSGFDTNEHFTYLTCSNWPIYSS